MILTFAGEIELLAAGVGGDLATATVILSKSAVSESRGAVIGDFDTPDYETYAPIAVAAWGDPYVDVDGVGRVDGGDVLFQPVNADMPNNIYAWGLANAGGTVLYALHNFDAPIPLDDALHGVLVDVEIAWGS